jgi:HK97 family phage major capsid protein
MTRTKSVRQLLAKALSMEGGGGAEVTLQQTIANEVIPLIREQNYLRGIAERAGQSANMSKPSLRIPKLSMASGVYGVEPGKPAPEFHAYFDGIDLRPRKIMSWMAIEQEVFEDSTITDMEGILKKEMGKAFAEGEESGWLFGDIGGTFDPGDTRNLFDGIFKQASIANSYTYDPALDATGADQNNVVFSNIIRAMSNLGKYGRNKRKLIVMIGTRLESALIRSNKLQTLATYAYGGGAGAFTGELGRISGATVISSTYLDAQPGQTTSRAIIFEESAFMIADWKSFDIKVNDTLLMRTDEVAICARERVAMAVRYPEAITQILNMPAQV